MLHGRQDLAPKRPAQFALMQDTYYLQPTGYIELMVEATIAALRHCFCKLRFRAEAKQCQTRQCLTERYLCLVSRWDQTVTF